jgi:hypothetical protein
MVIMDGDVECVLEDDHCIMEDHHGFHVRYIISIYLYIIYIYIYIYRHNYIQA